MKFVVFLALWAVASSVPLRGSITQWPVNWWTLQGYEQERTQPWQQGSTWVVPSQLGRQNSARQLSQQIGEQLQQVQLQNAVSQQQGGNSFGQSTQKIIAQQTAQQITKQVEQTKQIIIQNIIQQLQQQLQQQQQWNVVERQFVNQQLQQGEIVEAIRQLQQIQQRSLVTSQGSQNKLVQTLEAAIEAQLVANTVESQQTQNGRIPQTPTQNSEVFQARVQQLIDQSNIRDIEREIGEQERNIQQLQQQQRFINQQRLQIQVQQSVVQQSQRPQSNQQLQQAQQNLQQQEQQLLQQQLARQIVVQQLQQVLIEQQSQLQQDTLTEQTNEQVSQIPWSQVGSTLPGSLWTQIQNPQTPIVNLLAQRNKQWNQAGQQQFQPDYRWQQNNDVWSV